MALTQEEKTAIEYQNDIDRLDAQRKSLQAQVDALAVQYKETYDKKSKVAQEVEIMKIEGQTALKNVDQERAKLLSIKKENESKETNLKFANEKLSAEKESFRTERKIYEQRLKELQENEGLYAQKVKNLKAEEERLENLKSDIEVQERRLNSEIATLKIELESALNTAKSEAVEAKKDREESEKIKAECAKKMNDLQTSAEHQKKTLDEKQKVFDAENEAIKQHLKKRELAIVDKEKELENLKLEYQAKLDDIKIQKGRDASGIEAPKKKK